MALKNSQKSQQKKDDKNPQNSVVTEDAEFSVQFTSCTVLYGAETGPDYKILCSKWEHSLASYSVKMPPMYLLS